MEVLANCTGTKPFVLLDDLGKDWYLMLDINTNAGTTYTDFSFKFKHSKWFTNQGKILFFPLQGTCVSNGYLDSMKAH